MAAIAATLSHFPEEVITQVTHPVTGLPSKKSWLPTVKEVHDACAEAVEPIIYRERYAQRVAEQLEERKRETLERAERPTREQLQEKYGENWGLESLAQPVRKPKPAPTADELREHYTKFNLGFQPKEGEQ